jgi:hypothetical protein
LFFHYAANVFGSSRYRVKTAGVGSILVNSTPLGLEKRTSPPGVVFHLEHQHWQAAVVSDLVSSVLIQEITRGDPHAVLETQHIVRGKGKIEIGAAFREAGNTGVASEREFTIHHGLHAAFFQVFPV